MDDSTVAGGTVDEGSAAERAAAYGQAHFRDLGRREWRGLRFDGGWFLAPQGADLDGRIGVVRLAVLDDGRIFPDDSTLPPEWVAARYAATAGRPMPAEDEARVRAAAGGYADLAPTSRRFCGGWLLAGPPGGDGPGCVAVLDDGTVVAEPVGSRFGVVFNRYEAEARRRGGGGGGGSMGRGEEA